MTNKIREHLSWEILHAVDLLLVAESMEPLKKKALVWKEQLEGKGMCLIVKRTKAMLSGKTIGKQMKVQNACVGRVLEVIPSSVSYVHRMKFRWVHKLCSIVKSQP